MLKNERPDIDDKRTTLLKAQGEFQVRLRQLEKSLLQALNDAKGNILNDDTVMEKLETLKTEAADITAKVIETSSIMLEVDSILETYTPFARGCSSIYFAVEQLRLLNPFYQFALGFFLEIFRAAVIENQKVGSVKDPSSRLEILIRDMFDMTFARCGRGLLHKDRLTLALALAQIYGRTWGKTLDEEEFGALYEVMDSKSAIDTTSIGIQLTDAQVKGLSALSHVPAFKNLVQLIQANGDKWQTVLQSQEPEDVAQLVSASTGKRHH